MATNATMIAGRYRLERRLGVGGMSTVHLAFDERLERPVAIKVLSADFALPVPSERFLREIETTAKLNHPHIVGVYDAGVQDGVAYLVQGI